MDISNKVLTLMEKNNSDWIKCIHNYDNKLVVQKVFYNLITYGLKVRKCIQDSKPEILKDLGLV